MRPGPRPTMRDVAAAAGVSLKSVSRVVNAEDGVSEALVARVRAAIDALGYRPDPTASTLRRSDRRSETVAAILEDLANPFSATLHGALVAALRPHGVLVLSASTEEDAGHEREALLAFLDRRVDGVVLMPTSTDHAWMASDRIGARHIVMVDRPAPGFPADLVVSDNHGGARTATAHLAAHGHRRIAFLGGPEAMHTAGERLAGYRAALAAAAIEADAGLIVTGLREPGQARAALGELLAGAQPPTAVFASQNLLAIGAIRGLRDLGRQRDVALVAFDDVELADALDPGLTVVAQDPGEIGRRAAAQLVRRLAGETAPPETHVIADTLIQRGSGEIAAPAG